MPPEVNVLIIASMAGLLLVSGLWARKTGEWRMLITVAIGIALFGVLLNRLFGFPRAPIVAMGPQEGRALWVALYICMVLGMFSQYCYRHFQRPKRIRTKWDWGLFIAPVFLSPIVFFPLAQSFMNAGLDLDNLTAPRFMIFFVAFENGFLWKEFFDHKKKEAAN